MKRKITLTIIIFLIVLISFFFVYPKKNNQILETKENNSNFISIMLEKETGTGDYSEGESFPQNGYFLNKNLSKCINGSKIKYEEGSIYITGNKTDRCYAYFDKDELGSICKNENLAECFIQNYKKDSSLIYHDGKCDYEGEENCELEAGDLSYRFSGANPSNYVCLDEKGTGACESNEDLYQIIGLFKNNDGQYEIKLIKAEGATVTQLGDDKLEGGAYYGLYKDTYIDYQSYYKGTDGEKLAIYHWNNSVSSIRGNNVNMWQESNLNKVNLNNFFYNYITKRADYLQKTIVSHTWITGGMALYADAKTIYDNELGINKVKEKDTVCYTQENIDTAKECTKEDIEYVDYIGLMYLSDYMYAALPKHWSTMSNNYSKAINDNWMHVGIHERTISRESISGNRTNQVGCTGNANYSTAFNYIAIRPSFYLTFDSKLKEGEGKLNNPYRIS